MKYPAAIALMAAAFLWAQKPAPPPVEEKLPKAPPVQPIPFSHKLHTANGLKCGDCHKIAGQGYTAGYPEESVCMACHIAIKKDSPHILKLAEFAKAKRKVPWAKVYEVPDYVWFSHASHFHDAKIQCESCHGPVAERDALFKEKPTNMTSCMQCHAEHGAPNGCDFCHNSQ
jgi:hypothetical protein